MIIEILKRNRYVFYFLIIYVKCIFLYNIFYFIIFYFFNRCFVFLIDKEIKELVVEVFDGIFINNKEVFLKFFIYILSN